MNHAVSSHKMICAILLTLLSQVSGIPSQLLAVFTQMPSLLVGPLVRWRRQWPHAGWTRRGVRLGRSGVAQICNLSVSLKIVARGRDLLVGRDSWRADEAARECALTPVSARACATGAASSPRRREDARPTFWLRLRRAAPYRRIVFCGTLAKSRALERLDTLPMTHRHCGKLQSSDTLRGVLVLAFSTLALVQTAAVTRPLMWRWSNPSAHGNNIVSMAHRAGWVVQVAERGQIYVSRDLNQWIPRDSNTTNALRSVAFFGEKVVITGENGAILIANSVEPNQPFVRFDVPTTDWLEGVAASPGLLVAVGDNAAIYTSTNGIAWQRRPQTFSTWLRSVAYGNGQFVAVGENGFVITSQNGVDWRQPNSGVTEHLNRVAWVQDQFVAVGESGRALSSTNGATWQPLSTGAATALQTVNGNSQALLVAGNNELRLQENGAWIDEIHPSHHNFPAPNWTYLSSVWDGTLFLVGGRTGMIVEGFKTNSASPTIWVDRYGSLRNWLWDITRTPEFYIAVGDRATVMTSENGIHWDVELVPNSLTNAVFLGVGGTSNLFLVVGNQGRAMFSTNGVVWSALSMPTDNDLQGVGAANGLFVVTGGAGTILTSPNGTSWMTQSASTAAFLSSVTSFSGGFVTAGSTGTILTSPDGRNWTLRLSGTTNWVYRIRSFGNQLVAVGQAGTILTSPDGANWTARASSVTNWLNDVVRVGNAYFIAGTQGTVLQSDDAIQWRNVGTITHKSLFGLAANNGQLIAVGLEGSILRSQVIPDLTPIVIKSFRHTGQQSVFLFSGKADQRFTLDHSPNLSRWASGTALEFLDGFNAFIYEERSTNVFDKEFFRATIR